MLTLRHTLFAGAAALALSLVACGGAPQGTRQLSPDDDVFFADPTIILLDGTYYMAGTHDSVPRGVNLPGFKVLRSTDLAEWTPADSDTLPNLTPGEGVF